MHLASYPSVADEHRDFVEHIATSHLNNFCKPDLMITRSVVIPGHREAFNFIITRVELKSDSFMEFNRTSIHRRRTRPHNCPAMPSADFKKALI